MMKLRVPVLLKSLFERIGLEGLEPKNWPSRKRQRSLRIMRDTKLASPTLTTEHRTKYHKYEDLKTWAAGEAKTTREYEFLIQSIAERIGL